MSHNLFQFIGNLTRDAEFVQAESSKRATVDIAVNRVWRDSTTNEKKEATDYFRIKAFGTLAESAGKFLGKGSKVFVQGRIAPFKYDKDGRTEYGVDFIADGIDFLHTKEPGQSGHTE